jgi:hypothetical protein
VICPDQPIEPPQVAAGRIVHLEADDWHYGRGADQGQSVRLRVERVRADLARFYGGQRVWVQGHRETCPTDHPPCRGAAGTALGAAASRRYRVSRQ